MKPYPQMPAFTQAELEAFLNEAPVARLCSHNPDGTIHVAPGYFKYDHGELLMGTQDMTRKVKNIKKNPLVTVLIDNQAPPWKGVIIYGQATLDYDDVIAKRIAIMERYMPPDNAKMLVNMLAAHYTPVVIRIVPTQIISYDYSKPGFVQNLGK